MKKIIIILMLFVYSFSILPMNVFASNNSNNDSSFEELSASKISVLDTSKVGEYDIKIKVPGKESTVISGYNFLFVVDASTSTNGTKWNNMRKAIVDVVDVLLPDSDSSKNINKVALMTFGIGEHLNVSLTSDKSEFSDLPTNAGQSMLLPGRSATNNEVGLSGAYDYLNGLNEDLKKNANRTYVLYLTDGESNLNEKETDFYSIAKNSYWTTMKRLSLSVLLTFYEYAEIERASVISNTINEIGSEFFDKCILEIDTITESINADTTLNDTQKKNKINTEVNKIINTYADGDLNEILDKYIETLFDLIGYQKESTYSASDYEALVNSYKFSSNLEFQQMAEDCFYYPIMALGKDRVENANRAVDAGNKLKEIATIYTIAYNTSGSLTRDDAKKIMIPDCTSFSSSSYEANTGVNGNHFSSGYYFTTIDKVVEVFSKLTHDLVYTNYVNTEIIDYTSKWVIPIDTNGDSVFDEKDVVVTNNGEVVEADVTVTKLSVEEINSSIDIEVNGNDSDNIYKITWNLPDKFKQDDHFELSYRVKVDTEENGFVSDNEYKANGKTTITYDVIETGPNGEVEIANDIEHDIKVPVVKQKENIVVITKKDDSGNLLSGADFELISMDKVKQLNVLYSKDGTNWSNDKEGAVYFKFSGLYDAEYQIKETKVPENYTATKDELSFDFINKEGQKEEMVVVNNANKGKVVVQYVILVDGEYIPLNVYGKDEEGNVTPDFEGVNIEDETFEGKVGDEFTTDYREINEYTFVGLYKDSINDNNKLEGNVVSSQYSDEEQVYIYVYEPPIGEGEPPLEEETPPTEEELPPTEEELPPLEEEKPPVTGVENEINVYAKLGLFISFVGILGYSIKKFNEEN